METEKLKIRKWWTFCKVFGKNVLSVCNTSISLKQSNLSEKTQWAVFHVPQCALAKIYILIEYSKRMSLAILQRCFMLGSLFSYTHVLTLAAREACGTVTDVPASGVHTGTSVLTGVGTNTLVLVVVAVFSFITQPAVTSITSSYGIIFSTCSKTAGVPPTLGPCVCCGVGSVCACDKASPVAALNGGVIPQSFSWTFDGHTHTLTDTLDKPGTVRRVVGKVYPRSTHSVHLGLGSSSFPSLGHAQSCKACQTKNNTEHVSVPARHDAAASVLCDVTKKRPAADE